MRAPTLRVVWQAIAGLVGMAFLGIGSANALISLDSLWMVPLVLVAGLASWFEIPIEPYGTLNISPVVFLVATSAFDVWLGIVLAVLSPLVGSIAHHLLGSRSSTFVHALETGGEGAVALGLASALTGLLSRHRVADLPYLLELSFFVLVFVLVLRLLRVALTESVSLIRLLGPLTRKAFPHLAAMLAAVPLVWLGFSLFGTIGLVLSIVALVETYYPWKLMGEQRSLFLRSLQMMSNAVDLKDPYTAHHSKRVAETSVKLARALSVPEEEVERVRIGGLMHDIGKIAVPGHIIRKPSRLTDEEMNVMKEHAEAGAALIGDLEILKQSTQIVLYHHENYDGSGYPSGLAGEAIPLGSRIVFVADAYDALTTDRPYRKGRSSAEAMEIVGANIGKQFDRRVVEALKGFLPRH